eukprot:gene27653-33397_t
MSSGVPLYRQPWFIPLSILLAILLWLQFMPRSSVDPHEARLSSEAIKSLITSEVRTQLMSPAVRYTTKDMSNYPPVKALPDSQRLRILVTGGAGFVGSHL